ncbi:Inner membrane ABC transporter permease protein YtfT [Polystyrenella longa]|uniref:Inner membrane ABC transporter permease protein YtfT n=1 Tax=Polystyrenella longa TaxID=2528007 RepID=A0A518CI78_9PLAN|nr:ABC transporter permease [Polystyrenella longa]QDU78936.1 Inner membrane ABC transporter permease protein YtfT [Polystyrenella longa]
MTNSSAKTDPASPKYKPARSTAQLIYRQSPPAVRQRILFLLFGNLVLLGYLFFAAQQRESSFWNELVDLGPNIAPQVLGAFALTGLIFCGAIDLSIGSIIAVAGSTFGILHYYEFSPAVCYAGCFSTAVAFSVLNGWLIRLLEVSPIILTLGGLTLYRGLALIIAHLTVPDFPEVFSIQDEAYQGPGKFYAGEILLVVMIGVLLWEAFGKLPRLWLAIGCSPVACERQGLNPARLRSLAFLVSGLFLGLAALTLVTNPQEIKPGQIAIGFELTVIGAVVLGGTNIFGGQGTYLGSALGACFLYLVSRSMIYLGVDVYWREAIEGAVIVSVIGIDCWLHRTEKLLEELK